MKKEVYHVIGFVILSIAVSMLLFGVKESITGHVINNETVDGGFFSGSFGGFFSKGSNTITSTSIDKNFEVNNYPCISYQNQSSVAKVLQYKSAKYELKKGYELILEPFLLKCDNDVLDITLSIPENYEDIIIQKCDNTACIDITSEEVDDLDCSKEIILKENIYHFPEDSEINVSITSETDNIEYEKVSYPVLEPKNPSLKLIADPINIMLSKKENLHISLPYQVDEDIVEDTISLYLFNNKSWEYIDSLLDKDKKIISADIKIEDYGADELIVGIAGVICLECKETTFKKVYDSKDSKEAIVFVHGLKSTSLTFKSIIDDIILTSQPWDIYTYDYPSTYDIEDITKEFADLLEHHDEQYDKLYFVTHSLGGIITEKTLDYSKENNYNFIKKVKKVILVGVPHNGSNIAVAHKELFRWLAGEEKYHLFDISKNTMELLSRPSNTTTIKGISYYVIAGTKDIEFLNLRSSKVFDIDDKNDGVVSVKSAYTISGEEYDTLCNNYWEVYANHLDLIEESKKRIEKIISNDISDDADDKAILGNQIYLKIQISSCKEDNYYVVSGKKIDSKKLYDEGCNCGNNICGIGENKDNCPQDCSIKEKIISFEMISYILLIICIIALIITYLRYQMIGIDDNKRKKSNKERDDKNKKRLNNNLSRLGYSKDIETEIDVLFKLISDKKRINIEGAIKELNESKEKIDEWATILERNNLITIHYPVMGGVEFILKE